MRCVFNKNALTLTELLAATIVTGIVMIGVASMDISLRNAFEGTSRGSITASRVSTIMHHISRHILEACGNHADPGVIVDASNKRLRIRTDTTPWNTTDGAQWYIYKFNSGQNTLTYCATSDSSSVTCQGSEQEFKNIVSFEPSPIFDDPNNYIFSVRVTIASRYNTASAADDLKNPEYTLISTFNLPNSSGNAP